MRSCKSLLQELSWQYMGENGLNEGATQFITTPLPSIVRYLPRGRTKKPRRKTGSDRAELYLCKVFELLHSVDGAVAHPTRDRVCGACTSHSHRTDAIREHNSSAHSHSVLCSTSFGSEACG